MNPPVGQFQFSQAVYTVVETAGSATITIVRDIAGPATTVDFATADNTAVAGTDYTAPTPDPVTVSFAIGQKSATVTVPVLDSGVAHGQITANLTLSNPTAGASLGPQDFATLAITGKSPFTITGNVSRRRRRLALCRADHDPRRRIRSYISLVDHCRLAAARALPRRQRADGERRGHAHDRERDPVHFHGASFRRRAGERHRVAAVLDHDRHSLDSTPVIQTTSLPSGPVGGVYSTDLTATEGTPGYTWSLSSGSLPPGLSLDAFTGQIAGTPTAVGTTAFTVEVTDSANKTATQPLSITIAPAPVAITTLSLPNGAVGVPYTQPVGSTGGLGPTYTWTLLTGTLPTTSSAVLVISGTGPIMTLSGTPSAAGSFDFTLQVSDDGQTGVVGTQRYLVTIGSPAAPTITTLVLGPGTEGTPFTQTVTEVGGTGPFDWTITDGGLPPGLTIDGATGTISGTPTLNGTFTVTIEVTDANDKTSSETYQFVVASPPEIVTSSLPDAIQDNGYSSELIGTGGVGPYVWTLTGATPVTIAGGQLTGGGLPVGISLSTSTGLLSGVATVTGSYPITVELTDVNGATVTKDLTLTVVAPGGLPVIVTTSLAGGTVGVPYSAPLAALGGTPPYTTWTLTSGLLPTGLTLDATTGVISGLPASPPPGPRPTSRSPSRTRRPTPRCRRR